MNSLDKDWSYLAMVNSSTEKAGSIDWFSWFSGDQSETSRHQSSNPDFITQQLQDYEQVTSVLKTSVYLPINQESLFYRIVRLVEKLKPEHLIGSLPKLYKYLKYIIAIPVNFFRLIQTSLLISYTFKTILYTTNDGACSFK